MENKILFGIMTIIFNGIGVPDFMQGNVGKGIGKIAISLFTCYIGAVILEIMGIIRGIKILKMSDEEYKNAYLNKVEVTISKPETPAE